MNESWCFSSRGSAQPNSVATGGGDRGKTVRDIGARRAAVPMPSALLAALGRQPRAVDDRMEAGSDPLLIVARSLLPSVWGATFMPARNLE